MNMRGKGVTEKRPNMRNRNPKGDRGAKLCMARTSYKHLVCSDFATAIHSEVRRVEVKRSWIAILMQERVKVEVLEHIVRGERIGEVHASEVL